MNALGGLADSWLDSVPMIGICGNVPVNEQKGYSGIRQNGFQEMDIISVVRSITKYSVTPSSPERFAEIITRAYNMAVMGRMGRKGRMLIGWSYGGMGCGFPYTVGESFAEGRGKVIIHTLEHAYDFVSID